MITIEQFKECHSVVPTPVILVESDGRILAANRAAIREFALPSSNSAGCVYLQDLLSDDDDRIVEYLNRCSRVKLAVPASFLGEGLGRSVRYSFRGQLLNPPTGSTRSQVVLYIQAKDKVVQEFLILNEKIQQLSTEIKRRQSLEEERRVLLEREKKARENAERLFLKANGASKAKSLFLAQMSHEIRTPLNAILGFSDLLIEGISSKEENEQFLNRIRTNGRQLLRIIDDILDLSKFEAGKVPVESIKFSFVELINELAHSLRPLAENRELKLSLTFKTAIPQVIKSDPLRVRQVLLNLIGNALKFTEQGQVEVLVSFSTAVNDKHLPGLVIDILDTGIGVSPEQQKRLFQPFEQGDTSTNRRFGGTGLGLVVSKKIAQALEGDLQLLSSRPLQGSCFRFTLPTGDVSNTLFVTQAHDMHLEPLRALQSVRQKGSQLQSKHILLAEDSPDGAALATLYLQSEGAKVTHVTNGFKAIEAAKNDSFDLILMDVQMPEMDGLEATRHLRASGFSKPILALTAHVLREEAERSLQAGCDAHLTKPINKADLTRKILEALESSHPTVSRKESSFRECGHDESGDREAENRIGE